MSSWKEFIEEYEKTEEKEEVEEEIEVEEVKEEVIPPVIIKPIPIRHKPIIHKEALTEEEIMALIEKRISLIEGKTRKEQEIEIDPEKLYVKLRSLDPAAPENAYYRVIIERAKSGRKSGYLEPYASVINKYFDEVTKKRLKIEQK